MKVVIIEDEALAAERLERLLHRHDPQIHILAQLASVETSLEWFKTQEEPDLIFADIQLSDGLCFELFEEIRPNCPVIFTTSYDQYALNAFEVNSVAYLLKPIRFEKLVQSLEKLEEFKAQFAQEVDVQALAKEILQHNAPPKSRFLVKNGTQIRSVKAEEIAYFYADQKITLLVTWEGRRYPMDHSLDRLTEMLDPHVFFRANRRFLIHIDAAAEIRPYFKGRLKLALQPPTEEEVVISSERTPSFKQWLDQ
ncbi:MAG: LytTR family DNA-binding domain-containing protein [Bacteroidota bacterium]